MRTSQEIQAEMDAVQEKFPELKALTSTSQVSVFRLLKNMWVMLVLAIEQRVDALIADTNVALTQNQVGSLAWYVAMIKAFQYGDSVSVYDGSRIGYAVANPDKQIIKQAAVTEGADGRLLAKVAKPLGNAMGPITPDELAALKEYVRQVKYAGVAIDVISLSADEFKLNVTVKYDRLVMNAQGQRLSDGANVVLNAIIIYVRSLPFDSVLNWTALTDFLQQQSGVLDFKISRAFIRPAGTTAWTEFDRETVSRAGHMTLNVGESVLTYV